MLGAALEQHDALCELEESFDLDIRHRELPPVEGNSETDRTLSTFATSFQCPSIAWQC